MLTLICGLPNAGKTTYSKRFRNVVHLDMMYPKLLFDKYAECARRASMYDGDVCVEGLFTERRWRKMLLDACPHQSPRVCIWLNTALGECMEREDAFRKRSRHMVRSHYDRLEPPDLSEGWDVIEVING